MNNSATRYMLFFAGGQCYAAAAETVDEIAAILPEFPIPGAPRFLRGVVNIHGKVATVLDLSLFLGHGPTRQGRNLLLLKMTGTALAIVVEQLGKMISADEIISHESGESEPGRSVLTLADGQAILLDVEPLVASVEKALLL